MNEWRTGRRKYGVCLEKFGMMMWCGVHVQAYERTNYSPGIRFESSNLSSKENVFLPWICRSSSSTRCDVCPYVMWEILNGMKNRKEKLFSLQSMYSLSTRRVVTMPSTHQPIFLSGPPLNLINGDGDDEVDDGGSGRVLYCEYIYIGWWWWRWCCRRWWVKKREKP